MTKAVTLFTNDMTKVRFYGKMTNMSLRGQNLTFPRNERWAYFEHVLLDDILYHSTLKPTRQNSQYSHLFKLNRYDIMTDMTGKKLILYASILTKIHWYGNPRVHLFHVLGLPVKQG